MNNYLLVLIILIILILHYSLINRIEKMILNSNDIDNRPKCLDNYQYEISCMGTPSGNMETLCIGLVIIGYYLQSRLFILFGLLSIILMAYQRIYSEKQNEYQVIFGTFLGLIYGICYTRFEPEYMLLFTMFIIIFIISLYIIKYSKIIKDEAYNIPDWVDKDLYEIIDKKINSDLRVQDLLATISQTTIIFATWKTFESMLDALVDKIDISKVDAIIGIKSGGAFMANYLGKKYNKPYSYIKIKTKDYNYTTNTTTSMYAKIIYKNKWNYEYDIIEKPKIDVNGKNILLVDEIVDTGDTMKEIIKILKSEGTKSIIPMTFFQVVRPRNSKYTKIDGLIQGKEKFICFPWGYDN